MNAWERGSNWRRRLLIGWLALGWVIALALMIPAGLSINVARAATSAAQAIPSPTATATGSPYSPIGLKFDSEGTTGASAIAIVNGIKVVSAECSPLTPPHPGYTPRYVVQNARVTGNDETGTDHDDDLGSYRCVYIFTK